MKTLLTVLIIGLVIFGVGYFIFNDSKTQPTSPTDPSDTKSDNSNNMEKPEENMPESSASFENKQWVLKEYASVLNNGMATVPTEVSVTAKFVDGQVGGNSGCNSYSSSYITEEPNVLEIDDKIASTLMGCMGPEADVEGEYLSNLGEVMFFETGNGNLLLYNESNELILMYEELKSSAMEDTLWEVLSVNNGKEAVTTLPQGVEMTATFASDGTLTGNAGCNQYNTTYEINGEVITIDGPIGTTFMMCDEDTMEYEQYYLAALPQAETIEMSPGKITLRDANGSMLVNYVQ